MTGVGGEERGCDGGKKVKGRKRHLLVDTKGYVLEAKLHSAKVMDYEGIKRLLENAGEQFARLSICGWPALIEERARTEGKGTRMERGTHRKSAQTCPRGGANGVGCRM